MACTLVESGLLGKPLPWNTPVGSHHDGEVEVRVIQWIKVQQRVDLK
jgi:hypothetical protein